MTARSSRTFAMYSRKPVKNAPAPRAMTVRSRKIHRPNANRLSMFVWFRPFTRHKPAEKSPNSSNAIQGRIHSRNLPVPQRFTPRAMNSLSTRVLLCRHRNQWGTLSAVGPRRARDLPHPLPLRAVVNFRFGSDFLEHPEALRPLGVLRGDARRVVQISELDRPRRARLHARRHIIRRI